MEKVPMLAEGYERLTADLKALRDERPRIVEAIEEARAHGDLSENAEYHAAKERQGQVEAMIGEQEDIGLEARLLLDREGFCCRIALLHRLLVGDKRACIEIIGAQVRIAESIFHPEPGIGRGDEILAEINGRANKVFECVATLTWMRHEDLRVFLEHGGDNDRRHILLDRCKGLNHIAAHDEFEAAGGEHQARVGLRAALDDLNVEAVFRISAVGERDRKSVV